jgi:hypothetical protein
MKKLLFLGLMVSALLMACSKDKFETVPQVTITSFGPDEVRKGELFRLTAEVTDKEGDLRDTFYLVQKRYNGNTLLTTDTLLPGYSLKNFGFPTKNKIELQLTFAYGETIDNTITYTKQEAIDIGLVYGIIVQDTAKNKSPYVETKKIILKKV